MHPVSGRSVGERDPDFVRQRIVSDVILARHYRAMTALDAICKTASPRPTAIV